MSLLKSIQHEAAELLQESIQHRRHLHAHPELSYQEKETSIYVQKQLEKIGIDYKGGIADNGIVALIKGNKPESKVVAMRADMDALPIFEKNDIPYKSKNEGVMHACGHDAHTSSLLSAAKILNNIKDQFSGSIKLIFQPAEEVFPGGASIMIKEGVLENPTPSGIIGQHVLPSMDAGKVGFKSGNAMASADEIYIQVKGKGGHGAMPHLTHDPIAISATLISSLQQLVSRSANPLDPCVLTFGKIEGLGATNIIPEEVKLEGTFRAFNEKWRYKAHELLKQQCKSIGEAFNATIEIEIRVGYPVLICDELLTQRAVEASKEYMGEENVLDIPARMGAEDFAYYTHHTKGVFYRLGTGNDKLDTRHGLHTPQFNIDESSLEHGAGLFAWLALQELEFTS